MGGELIGSMVQCKQCARGRGAQCEAECFQTRSTQAVLH